MNEHKSPDRSEFKGKVYLGSIEDVKDPNRIGRCKIRVHGVFDEIPVQDIPWAKPSSKSTFFGKAGKAGSISVPKKGALVKVEFDDGDIYSPMYYEIVELGDDIRSELSKGSFDDYEGSHIILFDEDAELKIWYNREKGLTFQLKGSRINVAPDSSITIEHKESKSIIELEGPNIRMTSDTQITMTSGTQIKTSSNQVWLDGKFTRIGHSDVTGPAMLGDRTFLLLKLLAAAIDSKTPATPGFCANLVDTFKQLALSSTVTVGK
jgi:hypothetical protein